MKSLELQLNKPKKAAQKGGFFDDYLLKELTFVLKYVNIIKLGYF